MGAMSSRPYSRKKYWYIKSFQHYVEVDVNSSTSALA